MVTGHQVGSGVSRWMGGAEWLNWVVANVDVAVA